jgi:hypothetical protein
MMAKSGQRFSHILHPEQSSGRTTSATNVPIASTWRGQNLTQIPQDLHQAGLIFTSGLVKESLQFLSIEKNNSLNLIN